MKEIETTATYEKVKENCQDIVNRHQRIDVPSEYRCLPRLPKLHKQPYGTRFIAASHKCTTKPLSELLTNCLKLIGNRYKQYCNHIFCRTGVKCFWIIDNSQVFSTLNQINSLYTARHFHYTQAFHMWHSRKL